MGTNQNKFRDLVRRHYNPLDFHPAPPCIGRKPISELELAEHHLSVIDHLQGVKAFARHLYRPIVAEVSFESLYAAVASFVIGYPKWITSYFPRERDCSFVRMELSIYGAAACYHKSFKTWWWAMFSNVSLWTSGVLAFMRIQDEAKRSSKENLAVYDYGNFKPFEYSLGLEGKRTPAVDEEIITIFSDKEHPYANIAERLRSETIDLWKFKSRTKFEKKYDQVTDYMEEVFRAIAGKEPQDALKELFNRSLFKKTRIRATDRHKNLITEERTQKRGGLAPKEIGKLIKEERERQGLSIHQVERMTNLSYAYIQQIEEGTRKEIWKTTIQKLSSALKIDSSDVLGPKWKEVSLDQPVGEDEEGKEVYPQIPLKTSTDDLNTIIAVKQILDRYTGNPIKQQIIRNCLLPYETEKELSNRIRVSDRYTRKIINEFKESQLFKTLKRDH